MGDKKITPFVEWLEQYKKGEVDGELTHELRTLIEAVQDTGKPGTITLTLKVSRKGGVEGAGITALWGTARSEAGR